MKRNSRALSCILNCLALIAAGLTLSCSHPPPERRPLSSVRTIAGASREADAARFDDPFGIAVAGDGTIYLSDGESGRIWRIGANGAAKIVAENLDTPSGVALAADGTLVVADTGSHTIKRVDLQSGRVSVIAGTLNRPGFADGEGEAALFNGPVGVAVGADGTIFVADSYNDRIRAIDSEGRVRTVAGGDEPGFADAARGTDARFDTPCGIAVDTDGTLIVADTGNHCLRRISPDGAVTTLAGNGVRGTFDESPLSASFNEPTSVAVDKNGTIYVADAGSGQVRVCEFGLWPEVSTLTGRSSVGLSDGTLEKARLNRPSGIAISPDGAVLVADTGNKLIRAIAREGATRGIELSREAISALGPKASEFRAQAPPRWPYDPPERPREIAATFGEIRGEIGGEDEARFHNGLDIPGAYGETVRLVRSERVLRPLAVDDVGGIRERIRFPSLGYIHLRIGRDKDDRAFTDERFIVQRDASGKVAGVRVRRGAHFNAGDAIGTLNNQNHVHLIAGPVGSEFNALAALELPSIKDTVAPVIEKDGVRLFDREGHELVDSFSTRDGKRAPASEKPVTVHGDVSVVVRAYDQMDGNAARRRLGLYQLGYQVLNQDGTPAPGFNEPLWTISFETLPEDFSAAPIAYAPGSRAGATGETIFAYIVTNVVRDRAATEDFWHTDRLPEGNYVLRVFAADFFGNRATRDIAVRVVASGP
jgi:sugar lactone lactonase YvrE